MKQKLKPLVAKYEKISQESYVALSDGSELRVLQSKADKKSSTGYTLFVVPGWNSAVPSWDIFLMEAVHYFDIVYFESREKYSSKLNWKTKNTLDRISEDVAEVVHLLELDEEKLVMFASSWGVIFLTDALANKKIQPYVTFLAGVTAKLTLPKGTRHLIPYVPPITLIIVKPLLRWWLINSKSESQEQAQKNLRNLEESDPRKWKKVVKYSMGYQWDNYAKIEQDIVIVGAEKDKMHSFKESQKIRSLIKNLTYIDMESNKNVHSEDMVTEIRKHLQKMKEGR